MFIVIGSPRQESAPYEQNSLLSYSFYDIKETKRRSRVASIPVSYSGKSGAQITARKTFIVMEIFIVSLRPPRKFLHVTLIKP